MFVDGKFNINLSEAIIPNLPFQHPTSSTTAAVQYKSPHRATVIAFQTFSLLHWASSFWFAQSIEPGNEALLRRLACGDGFGQPDTMLTSSPVSLTRHKDLQGKQIATRQGTPVAFRHQPVPQVQVPQAAKNPNVSGRFLRQRCQPAPQPVQIRHLPKLSPYRPRYPHCLRNLLVLPIMARVQVSSFRFIHLHWFDLGCGFDRFSHPKIILDHPCCWWCLVDPWSLGHPETCRGVATFLPGGKCFRPVCFRIGNIIV